MEELGLLALDLVLRAYETVAALPTVVHNIRRFADPPLFPKLKSAMATLNSITTMEQLLLAHSEDVWLDALKGCTSFYGQQHVMDWIYDVHADADVELAMEAVVMQNLVDTLVCLHERYPESRLSLLTMKQIAATSYRAQIATRLITSFPERYFGADSKLLN